MGAPDANGIYQYDETDTAAAASTMLNRLASSVSAALADSGWTAAPLTMASGWTAVAAGPWQALKIRSIGKRHRLNGTVQKNAAYAASEVFCTVAAGKRPVGRVQHNGNANVTIDADGTVRVITSGSANVAFGVDLEWWA